MLFQKSFMAGILIGMVSYMYLIIPNKLLGAFLFSIGLLTICIAELKLFTGAVGFQWDRELIGILLFNIVGIAFASLACIAMNRDIVEIAKEVAISKLSKDYGRLSIEAFFCGICMFYAVYPWRKEKFYVGIIGFVALFMISGFEHSIADLFYFMCSGMFYPEMIMKWIAILIGNIMGAKGAALMHRC